MQFCSAKNKIAKYKNADPILRIPMKFSLQIVRKRGDSTARHCAALRPSRMPKTEKTNSKRLPEARFGLRKSKLSARSAERKFSCIALGARGHLADA